MPPPYRAYFSVNRRPVERQGQSFATNLLGLLVDGRVRRVLLSCEADGLAHSARRTVWRQRSGMTPEPMRREGYQSDALICPV
jgi:hypothetical protein